MRSPVRTRQQDFDPKQYRDGADQYDDESFEVTEAAILKQQQQQNVCACNYDTDNQRYAK